MSTLCDIQIIAIPKPAVTKKSRYSVAKMVQYVSFASTRPNRERTAPGENVTKLISLRRPNLKLHLMRVLTLAKSKLGFEVATEHWLLINNGDEGSINTLLVRDLLLRHDGLLGLGGILHDSLLLVDGGALEVGVAYFFTSTFEMSTTVLVAMT